MLGRERQFHTGRNPETASVNDWLKNKKLLQCLFDRKLAEPQSSLILLLPECRNDVGNIMGINPTTQLTPLWIKGEDLFSNQFYI